MLEELSKKDGVFNYATREFIETSSLKEGQEFCSKCGGKGTEDAEFVSGYCKKCWGKGVLDWVEQITGREPPKYHHTSTSYYGNSLTCHICGTSGVGLTYNNKVTNI